MKKNTVKIIGGGQFLVKGVYIGTDWDYFSAIKSLGYGIHRRNEKCKHIYTDGTINCPDCGKTAIMFISEAADILLRLAA